MNILITGANGYIGKALYNLLKNKYNVISITRKEVDLTDSISVINYFKDKYFDVIIHCAVSGGKRTDTDSPETLDNNLKMYYNLLECKKHFNKLIHFGSGAEKQDTFYGLSKKIINKSIQDKDNFYNIRIFAVFDENELDTRFIKTNINKYLNNSPIEIFKNKKMDFFYMDDLVKLVDHYINNDDLPKEIDCSYDKSSSLLDIANLINTLDDSISPIKFYSQLDDKPYCGQFTDLGIEYVGLKQGIINVYNKLK